MSFNHEFNVRLIFKHLCNFAQYFFCSFVNFIATASEQQLVRNIYKYNSFVNFNIDAVPYSKLSTYAFFKGDIKNLNPVSRVIPYEPASSLFTDYASKKRFIWMSEGMKASYEADDKSLNFPVGTVLIKNFYYNTIQPGNTAKIIETRLMIKKHMYFPKSI